MDRQIAEIFTKYLNESLELGIISNATKPEEVSKVKLRPIHLKGSLYFQVTEYRGAQVFHQNYIREDLLNRLTQYFDNSFRQAELRSLDSQVTIMVSKKGTVTIKEKKRAAADLAQATEHNRPKQYILKEGNKIPFLLDLGIMSTEGKVIRTMYDKYRQMNRFLEMVEDILPELSGSDIRIIDFGCGKSYLTFAMYYFLKEIKGLSVRITGIDLKEDVIRDCNERKARYGYDELEFIEGDIATFDAKERVDLVVSLHACDTATDYALEKAVRWGAKVILCVPCCQHELNKTVKAKELDFCFRYGLIRERMAALMTDALRANLLEAYGYTTQILEFIDMEHTPKNILIRAVKKNKLPFAGLKQRKLEDYRQSIKFLGIENTLYRLLALDKPKGK